MKKWKREENEKKVNKERRGKEAEENERKIK